MAGRKTRRTKKRSHKRKRRCYPANRSVEGTSYVCEVCEKSFRQKSTFLLHSLIHKGEQTFSCNICKAEFTFLGGLQKHCLIEHSNDLLVVGRESDQVGSQNVGHPKPYSCKFCSKLFFGTLALSKHVSTKHPGNDEYSPRTLPSTAKSEKRKVSDSSESSDSDDDFSESDVKQEPEENSDEGSDPSYRPPTRNDLSRLSVESGESSELCVKVEPGESSELFEKVESGESSELFEKVESGESSELLEKVESGESSELRVKVEPGESSELCEKMESGEFPKLHIKLELEELPELFIKVEPDDFDPSEACMPLPNEFSFTCDEGLSDNPWPTDEKQFCCPVCNMKFAQESNMKSHFHFHEPKPANNKSCLTTPAPLKRNIGPFLCEICHKGFLKDEDFQKHCLTHSEQNLFRCKVCNKTFARYSNYRAHRETHTKKTVKYVCETCNETFARKKDFQKHCSTHSKLLMYLCKVCNKQFARYSIFKAHCLTHLDNTCNERQPATIVELRPSQRSSTFSQGPFHCEVCRKKFTTNEDFQKHCLTHSEQSIFFCKVCDKHFARLGNFKAHCEGHLSIINCKTCGTHIHFQKQLVANEEPKCRFCEKKSEQVCSSTTDEQSHRCEDCGAVYSELSYLRFHQLSHASENKCGICAETFVTNNLLQLHLATHFGSENVRREDVPLTCQLCNKGFPDALLLRNHLLEHEAKQDDEMQQNQTGENPENMAVSEKVTIEETSESYKDREDMPHTCQLCNEGFPDALLLRNHLLEHEAKQDDEMQQNQTGENPENMAVSEKVTIQETSESYKDREDMPLTCQLCNEGFPDALLLRNHLLEHEAKQDDEMQQNQTGENPENMAVSKKVTIEETSESYKDREDMPHTCQLCNEGFPDALLLRNHLLGHEAKQDDEMQQNQTGENPENMAVSEKVIIEETSESYKDREDMSLTCQLCNEGFPDALLLRNHLLEHEAKQDDEMQQNQTGENPENMASSEKVTIEETSESYKGIEKEKDC